MIDLRTRQAWHESGHAIAALAFGWRIKVARIGPDAIVLTHAPREALYTAREKMMFSMAGFIAAHKISGLDEDGVPLDWILAELRNARDWRGQVADNDVGQIARVLLSKTDDEACERIWLCNKQTRALLDEHWQAVELLAEALLVHDELSPDEVEQLLGPDYCSPIPA